MPRRKRKSRNTEPVDESVAAAPCLPETTPLQLRYYGDAVLRQRATAVERIAAAELQLAEEMLRTLYATGNGIGLAATQVGALKRLVIVDIGDENDDTYVPLILFNPEILSAAGEVIMEEGCLSLPGITADVKRPERIIVEGLNPQNQQIRIEADDLLARVLQHEIDHLNGILFIDRISGLKRKELTPELQEIQRAERPV